MKLAKSKSVQIWPLQLNDAVGLPLMAALLIRCLVKQNTDQKTRRTSNIDGHVEFVLDAFRALNDVQLAHHTTQTSFTFLNRRSRGVAPLSPPPEVTLAVS